jgi:hypothetical protein
LGYPKKEMGRECGTNERQERFTHHFGGGDLKKRDHYEGIAGRIILKWIFKKLNEVQGLD